MSGQHTQGRLQQGRLLDTPITWRWTQAQRESAESQERRMLFLDFTPVDQGRSRVRVAVCEDEEYARRFVACWNACEGMEDPEAEVAAIHKDSDYLMASERLRAKAIEQRDELLAALEKAEEWLTGWASAEPYLTSIRTVIAKVKGGAA
jgi:hypothetical protein